MLLRRWDSGSVSISIRIGVETETQGTLRNCFPVLTEVVALVSFTDGVIEVSKS